MEFRTFAETQLAEEIRRLSTGGAIISVPGTSAALGKPCHAIVHYCFAREDDLNEIIISCGC